MGQPLFGSYCIYNIYIQYLGTKMYCIYNIYIQYLGTKMFTVDVHLKYLDMYIAYLNIYIFQCKYMYDIYRIQIFSLSLTQRERKILDKASVIYFIIPIFLCPIYMFYHYYILLFILFYNRVQITKKNYPSQEQKIVMFLRTIDP